MKKLSLIVFFLTILLNVKAQVNGSFYAQVDLANRWVWRGVSYSEAPLLQPSLGYANDRWNFLIWGSYPLERRSYSEIDFTVEYQASNKLKLGITDFFGINDSIGANHEFFNVKRKTTMHMLDAYFIYSPFNKIPLSILVSFWFWGADRKVETLEQNFSSYVELKYEKEFSLFKASAFAGMTLWEGFYADKAALVNVGFGLSKNIPAGNTFSIPIKLEFVVNPKLQNTYINAVITFK